jgi:hypothetical protein
LGFIAVYYFPNEPKIATTIVQVLQHMRTVCSDLEIYLKKLSCPYSFYDVDHFHHFTFNGIPRRKIIPQFLFPSPEVHLYGFNGKIYKN